MSRLPTVALAGILVLAAGCSGGGGPSATGTARPVTEDEAALLAGVLVRDREAQGASFALRVDISGADVRFAGDVDWVNHVGTGVVSVGDAAGYQVRWTSDAVLQSLPGLAERLAGAGRPGVDWVARPADPKGSRLDVVIAFLTALGATTPDNPVNLRRQKDVFYLRQSDIGALSAIVLRKGGLTLWISEDGLLRRAEAPFAFATTPGVVDLSRFRKVDVALPARGAVVEAADYPAVYRELTQLLPL